MATTSEIQNTHKQKFDRSLESPARRNASGTVLQWKYYTPERRVGTASSSGNNKKGGTGSGTSASAERRRAQRQTAVVPPSPTKLLRETSSVTSHSGYTPNSKQQQQPRTVGPRECESVSSQHSSAAFSATSNMTIPGMVDGFSNSNNNNLNSSNPSPQLESFDGHGHPYTQVQNSSRSSVASREQSLGVSSEGDGRESSGRSGPQQPAQSDTFVLSGDGMAMLNAHGSMESQSPGVANEMQRDEAAASAQAPLAPESGDDDAPVHLVPNSIAEASGRSQQIGHEVGFQQPAQPDTFVLSADGMAMLNAHGSIESHSPDVVEEVRQPQGRSSSEAEATQHEEPPTRAHDATSANQESDDDAPVHLVPNDSAEASATMSPSGRDLGVLQSTVYPSSSLCPEQAGSEGGKTTDNKVCDSWALEDLRLYEQFLGEQSREIGGSDHDDDDDGDDIEFIEEDDEDAQPVALAAIAGATPKRDGERSSSQASSTTSMSPELKAARRQKMLHWTMATFAATMVTPFAVQAFFNLLRGGGGVPGGKNVDSAKNKWTMGSSMPAADFVGYPITPPWMTDRLTLLPRTRSCIWDSVKSVFGIRSLESFVQASMSGGSAFATEGGGLTFSFVLPVFSLAYLFIGAWAARIRTEAETTTNGCQEKKKSTGNGEESGSSSEVFDDEEELRARRAAVTCLASVGAGS